MRLLLHPVLYFVYSDLLGLDNLSLEVRNRRHRHHQYHQFHHHSVGRGRHRHHLRQTFLGILEFLLRGQHHRRHHWLRFRRHLAHLRRRRHCLHVGVRSLDNCHRQILVLLYRQHQLSLHMIRHRLIRLS